MQLFQYLKTIKGFIFTSFLVLMLVFSSTVQGKYATDSVEYIRAYENQDNKKNSLIINDIYMLSDGQFVNGPNVGNFSIDLFLESKNSSLRDYSFNVLDNSTEYSINPKVLLTILELRTGLITKTDTSPKEDPFGYADLNGFVEELDFFSESLYSNFYFKLYNPDSFKESIYLALSSGETIIINSKINAGSYALLATLAPITNINEFQQLISLTQENSFINIFKVLFPDSDPLDTSNMCYPEMKVPEDFLKLPFKGGDTWRFTGGPHGGVAPNFTSLDFAPGVSQCTVPSDRWIVSPADGVVTLVTCGGCRIEIDHGSNWKSYFYHVADPIVTQGQYVSKNQKIGHPSQRPACTGNCNNCGGSATGVHVHYTLLYNGCVQPIDQQLLENWEVHATSTEYAGYLERNGIIKSALNDDPIKSDYLKPVTTISISGNAGQNGWYVSNVTVSFSPTDADSGVRTTQYNINSSGWITYNFPFLLSINGLNNIAYQSKDWSGNLEDPLYASIPIDTIPPSNPLFIDTECQIDSNVWQNICNDLNFSWTDASDYGSGIAFYEYYWGGDPSGSNGVITPYSSYDPPPVSDGVYHLRLRTQDNAGNWSSWKSMFTLKYDGTSPAGSVTIEGGSEVTNKVLVTVETASEDNLSGVIQMRIRDLGKAWPEWQSNVPKVEWILPPVTGQTQSVEVQYRDQSGNLSDIYSDSIYLDVYPDHPSSGHFTLANSTFGMGATNASSENYVLRGTLSQESPSGYARSADYQVILGYWARMPSLIEFFQNFLPLIMK